MAGLQQNEMMTLKASEVYASENRARVKSI